jgi:hypothetical protein
MCDKNFKRKFITPLKWLHGRPTDHWFMAFWTSEKRRTTRS